MSTRALVYSIHCEKPSINDLLQWRELLYSVKTLRDFNTDVDVKVYLSPASIVDTITTFPVMDNLEIIGYDIPARENPFPNEVVAKWLDAKYTAAFAALELGYDSVLMLDADTKFQYDVNDIFWAYSEDEFYASKDPYDEFFSLVGMPLGGMNDGVVIIPKWALRIKDELLKARQSFTMSLIEKYTNKLDHTSDVWKMGMCWASFQYGISEYLRKIGRPVRWFDPLVVATLSDWGDMTLPEQQVVALLHYWNFGYKEHLPKVYWEDLKDNHMAELYDIGKD